MGNNPDNQLKAMLFGMMCECTVCFPGVQLPTTAT